MNFTVDERAHGESVNKSSIKSEFQFGKAGCSQDFASTLGAAVSAHTNILRVISKENTVHREVRGPAHARCGRRVKKCKGRPTEEAPCECENSRELVGGRQTGSDRSGSRAATRVAPTAGAARIGP